jgi:hypothetical protein
VYKIGEDLLVSLKTALEEFVELNKNDDNWVDSTHLISRSEELIKLLEEEYYIQ